MSLGTGDRNGKTQDAERDLGVNLHVFFRGCPEADCMIKFRDLLWTHGDDRKLYASAKRKLAEKNGNICRCKIRGSVVDFDQN